MLTKTCSTCSEERPVSEFSVSKSTRRPGYIYPTCKQCAATKSKEWSRANKDLVAASRKAYYEKNKERFAQYQKEHYNEEQMKVYRAKWKLANPDKHRESQHAYWLRNAESKKAYNSSWKAINKDKVNASTNKRRAKKLGNGGEHTAEEWLDLKERYNHTCPRCLKKEPDISLTLDHVVPLCKGGTDDIGNIQPLCLSCNSSKGAAIADYRYLTHAKCVPQEAA